MNHKINLAEKLAKVDKPFSPKIVGEVNDSLVKVARVEGAFVWHSHATQDELFLVISGRLDVEMRDRTVSLAPGELFIMPRGVEHRTVGKPTAEILLLQPASLVNTGAVTNHLTSRTQDQERI